MRYERHMTVCALVFVTLLLVAAAWAEDEMGETLYCGDFGYILTEDGSACVVKYAGRAQAVVVPSALDGYPVRAIGDRAFYQYESLRSIVLPNGITSIGDEAFFECSALKEAMLPQSLKHIGDMAFAQCNLYNGIELPQGLESIGAWAFFNGVSGFETELPESLTAIGDGAFAGCYQMEKFSISPDNPRYFVTDGVLYEKDTR